MHVCPSIMLLPMALMLCGPLAAQSPPSLPDRLDAAEQRLEALLAEVRAMPQAKRESWVFMTKHIEAATLADMLNPLLAGSGCRVSIDPRGLALAGPPAKLPAVKRAILKLDIERSEAAKDTRVIVIHHADPRDIAAAFYFGVRGQFTLVGYKVTPDVQAKAVIVWASPDEMKAIERLIEQLDLRTPWENRPSSST